MAQRDRSRMKWLTNGLAIDWRMRSLGRPLAASPLAASPRRRRLVGEPLEPRHLLAILAAATSGDAMPGLPLSAGKPLFLGLHLQLLQPHRMLTGELRVPSRQIATPA
ncbi:hypothetical protein TBK1r_34920 [Stieleria magnilauensis]|uniref:Uncharacterized protein n=1 Tax=Stieleria magnilauensis TaxID=2527963 RepID=A0ABX5XV54_9BACT|nr:hypothetical protein TBK1r_34920 [Planctomycetes bacterium TBK1r]